jgi:DNA-binding NtrC family response regulator
MSNKANILIVDHDEIVLIGLEHILEGAGHSTATAWSAKEALRLLDQAMFDLLLISEHLDDVDSATLLTKVKHLRPGVPVLVMHTQKTPSQDACNANCSGAVCKWEHDEVITRVRSCLAA